MKELLHFIVSQSLGPDEEFTIRQTETEQGMTFELVVPETMKGKIIGKAGLNIKAIRDVLNIVALRQNKRIFIKVME